MASVSSSVLVGADAVPVRVDAHIAEGPPGFDLTGVPGLAWRETRDRIRAALLSSHLKWPHKKITVSLTPYHRHIDSNLDLPIALSILLEDRQLPPKEVGDIAAVGELGLDGSVRAGRGGLPLVEALRPGPVIVPATMLHEARLARGRRPRAVDSLAALVGALRHGGPWQEPPPLLSPSAPDYDLPNLSDVKARHESRYALEVAAAGGHHILLVGTPDIGTTMLARCLPGLLPQLGSEHALELARVQSAAGQLLPKCELPRRPPFRSPHHNTSAVALVGGGARHLMPGEMSLAHHGVLFLHELGAFSPVLLENLRQPMEEGVIHLARAAGKATLPARALVMAAMAPCPCGEGRESELCSCSPPALTRYARRLPARLLDRFDLRVDIQQPAIHELPAGTAHESNEAVRARVEAARHRALSRGIHSNAQMSLSDIDTHAPLDDAASRLLVRALRESRLTGHGMFCVRRVALTVADLAGDDPPLNIHHVMAALALRSDLSHITGGTV